MDEKIEIRFGRPDEQERDSDQEEEGKKNIDYSEDYRGIGEPTPQEVIDAAVGWSDD